MQYWEIQAEAKKKRETLKKNYPDIGKIVRYKGETGIVVFDPNWKLEDERPDYKPGSYTEAYVVRWDTNKDWDYEEYGGFPYQYLSSYDFKYINLDGK